MFITGDNFPYYRCINIYIYIISVQNIAQFYVWGLTSKECYVMCSHQTFSSCFPQSELLSGTLHIFCLIEFLIFLVLSYKERAVPLLYCTRCAFYFVYIGVCVCYAHYILFNRTSRFVCAT